MKKIRIAVSLILSGLTLSTVGLALSSGFRSAHEVKAASPTVTTTTPSTVSNLPTTIDLNDTSESDIRNYYASAAGLSGTNLLIQLKTILITNPLNTAKPAQYYSYSNDRQIYKISDRQWSLYDVNGYDGSNTISGYSSANNQITSYDYSDDPYLHFYYRDDNETNPHQFSAKQTKVNSTSSHSMLCQEHLWSKSHGFSESGGVPNAGSDLHHLVAADYAVNSWAHSNYSYGVVSESVENNSFYNNACNWGVNESLSGKNAIINNKLGTAANFSEYDEGSATVFEPQDQDKGDIARALLFMVARYNWFGATDNSSVTEPYLELVNKVINGSENSSSGHGAVPYGCLNDLLIWHFNDLPDQYEIHRNNIIYNNFQHTRNPFIDFPEWVSYIWGRPQSNPTSSSSKYNPTGTANPTSDSINTLNPTGTVSVTGVSVSPSSQSIKNGSTLQLTATVSPSNATNKAVTWKSSKTSVATVSSSGLVTAKGTGTATITATTADGGFTSTCSLTVTSASVPVKGVSVSPTFATLTVGNTQQLTATVSPSNATNKAVSWSSGNSSIASVDSSGLVTANSVGSTTITVTTSDGGYTATCNVTVNSPVVSVTGVSLNTNSLNLSKNEDSQLTATVSPSNATDKTVTWSSSNSSVASVSSSGLVTAMGAGSATITVTTSDGGFTATCSVTVTAPVSGTLTINYGDTFSPALPTSSDSINASPTAHTDTTSDFAFKEAGIYKSSASYIMFSNGVGYLYNTANLGTVTKVTVNYHSGASDNGRVGVYFGTNEMSTYTSESNVAVDVSNGNEFTNSSVGYGYFQLSTSNYNCRITSIDVEYEAVGSDPVVTSVEVNPSSLTLDISGTLSGNLSANVSGLNNPAKTVTWSSNNTSVATVNSSGVVTAYATGTATITATSTVTTSQKGTCTVTVFDSSALPTASLTSGSPYINGIAYKMYFYSTNKSANYYFAGGMSGIYGSSTTAINSATDVYFQSHGTGQDIYFNDTNGVKQYLYIVYTGTYYNFGYTDSQPTTPWYYVVSENEGDYACMTYYTNDTYYTFGTYSTYTTFGTVNLGKYTTNYEIEFVSSDSTSSISYAQVFNDSITCDSTGTNTPTLTSGITWSQLKLVYDNLNESARSDLTDATFNVSRSGSTTTVTPTGSTTQIVANAMSKYDYIVGKYGTTTYSDFIHRNPAPFGNTFIHSFTEDSTNYLIVIFVTVISILAVTGFIIIRKKTRETN